MYAANAAQSNKEKHMSLKSFNSTRRGIVGAAIAGMIALATALPAVAQEFTLRMQSNLSPGQPGWIAMEQEFVNGVKEMSNGRVEIQLFPGGALYPVNEGLDAISSGIADMGIHAGFYFSGQMGNIASIESGLPGAEQNAVERYGFFYEKGFIDIARAAYSEQGVYYLAPNLSSPWELVSKVPLKSQADFKGKKIRGGGIEAQWFNSMGAEGVFLGGSEVYTALATGVVDAVRWGSADQNLDKGFHEVAKYYIKPAPMPAPNNHIIVNQATWDSLPADIQQIMDAAARLASLNYIAKGEANAAAALSTLVNEHGMEVSQIPADEWNAMAKNVQAIWAKYGEDGPHAAAAIDLLNEYLAELGR